MQNLPEVGKTYISALDPSLIVHVWNVHTIKAEPEYGIEPGFVVESCIPDTAYESEMTDHEWRKHGFTLKC